MVKVSKLALALLLGLASVSFSQESTEEQTKKSQQENELSKLKQDNEGGGYHQKLN